MELKRRVHDRMSIFLFILGSFAAALSVQNLDCTNDYEETMFCYFEAQNCSEYNLTLRSNDGYGDENCIFKPCEVGHCCCSVHQMTLVMGETHTATVWKGGKGLVSKNISITDSIKPKTPNITLVKESNGNFQIRWKTNQEGVFGDSLTANVTYHKKGDTQKVSVFVKPATLDGLNYYEILGRHLEPSTTYAVSVKSYTNHSHKFSDSSEEWEFTTPISPTALPLALVISLSIAAVIISGAVFGCYVKLKTKWWDTVAKCPNPKLLTMHPSEQEVLKPVPPIISSICVEPLVPDESKPWSKGSLRDTSIGSPQQSSGISTGSSCLSYAHTEPTDIIAGVKDALFKAFPNISPVSPLTTNPLDPELNKDSCLLSSTYNPCGVRADDMSSGSSGFDNKTYSIFIPSCQHQIMTDTSEVQTEMLCDSGYHPSAGDIVEPLCPLVNLPPVVSSLMPTDMSYQQCNANSEGFSYAKDSSMSSTPSGTNTIASCDPVSRVEVGLESFDEAGCGVTHGKTKCDENPCYGCVPTDSRSFPPVDDDYQSFQNLVEQPIMSSVERSGEKEGHLNTCLEESFTKMPQCFLRPVAPGFINNVQGGQCLSELQRPFLSLIPAEQSMPIITDSGYQCV